MLPPLPRSCSSEEGYGEFKIKAVNFDKKFFLAVGRLTRQKNFSYLIDEFYKFSLIDKEYNLIIIGEGEDRIKLQNLINNPYYLLNFVL